MVGETENLVIEHLRAIRGDIADIKADMREGGLSRFATLDWRSALAPMRLNARCGR
jgi:hypothetical protein